MPKPTTDISSITMSLSAIGGLLLTIGGILLKMFFSKMADISKKLDEIKHDLKEDIERHRHDIDDLYNKDRDRTEKLAGISARLDIIEKQHEKNHK